MSMPTGVAVGSELLRERHVNPQWVGILRLLRRDGRYTQCQDAELFSSVGCTRTRPRRAQFWSRVCPKSSRTSKWSARFAGWV